MENASTTYALTLFTYNEPAADATLSLRFDDGRSLSDLKTAAPDSTAPSQTTTVDLVPMTAVLSLEPGAPIPLRGFAMVSPLGPVYCFKFINAEPGPDWAMSFSLIDSQGESIGGYVSTSSPAIGVNWAFLGALNS